MSSSSRNPGRNGNGQAADRQSDQPDSVLSALLDGEATSFEVRRILGRLDENPSLQETWARYSLARSVLEGEPFRQAPDDFSARVMAAIEKQPRNTGAEPAEAADGAPSRRGMGGHWLYPAGRVAVAASVALAVFLGMQLSLDGEQPGETSMMADTREGPARNGASSDARIDTEAQRRLNEYIRNVAISGGSGRDSVEEALAELENLRSTPGLRPVSDRELLVPVPQESDSTR